MVTAALCKIKKKNAPPKNKVKSVMRPDARYEVQRLIFDRPKYSEGSGARVANSQYESKWEFFASSNILEMFIDVPMLKDGNYRIYDRHKGIYINNF